MSEVLFQSPWIVFKNRLDGEQIFQLFKMQESGPISPFFPPPGPYRGHKKFRNDLKVMAKVQGLTYSR